jgi:hypothetical protein
MSLSTVTDTIYTYRFLKLLVTPFNKTKAYEFGIVDEILLREIRLTSSTD